MPTCFTKSFTQQKPLAENAIDKAVEILRTGRLHRYNAHPDEIPQVAQLEANFAEYLGVRYCLACASGGYAIHIALKACGLKTGEDVLTNAFTLSPVPGAIHNAGGKVKLVEIDANYCIDIADLRTKMQAGSSARFLLLSHMRGHTADMDEITKLCDQHNVILIEDCAHTMGAQWGGKKSGTYGHVACFSTQTYKHLNSGEGGLMTTDDPQIMASAIILSGSYMFYEKHGTVPEAQYFDNVKLKTPNCSGRMDNLRAALLNEQLPELEKNCKAWNALHDYMLQQLKQINGIQLPVRNTKEQYVGSSIQFATPDLSEQQILTFQQNCLSRGVELKWFGGEHPVGFTSRYDSWQFIDEIPYLPKTHTILAKTWDMRIPLTFDKPDIMLITQIIKEELKHLSYR